MTKQYDGMLQKAGGQKTELKEVSRDEVASMKGNISLLQNIKQSVEEEEVNTYDDVLRKLETVRAVTENGGPAFTSEEILPVFRIRTRSRSTCWETVAKRDFRI